MRDDFKDIIKIIFTYLLISIVWIYLSNRVISTLNRLTFMFFSSLLFFFLLYREYKKREDLIKKLETEKENFSNLLNIASDIVVILDKSGKVQYINDRGCDLLGYKREEIINKDWFENFLPERIKHETKDIFYKILNGEESLFIKEVKNPILTKNKEEIIILWSNAIVKENNEIKAIISFGKDITEEEISKEEKEVFIAITEKIFRMEDFNSALQVALNKICEFFFCSLWRDMGFR